MGGRGSAGGATAASQASVGSAEGAIRGAYGDLVERTPTGWVNLADLREKIGDKMTRDELDAALKTLVREHKGILVPESDQSSLTPRDRKAALRIGGQYKHLLFIVK